MVGYLIVDIVDGCAHIEEVDVLPAAGGRGHGSRLIGAVADLGTLVRVHGADAHDLPGRAVERPVVRPPRLPSAPGRRAHPRVAPDFARSRKDTGCQRSSVW